MATMKVDLDVLLQTVRVYDAEIDNLNDAKKAIKRSLASLKASGWDSSASKAWFSLLDDEWLQNIDYQIRVLGRLRDNLNIAKDEYMDVYNEMQALKDYL